MTTSHTQTPFHFVLIGGHLTPALALAEYITLHHTDIQLTFIGRRYSQDTLKQLSQEAKEAEKLGMSFIPFEAPRTSFAHFWEKLFFPFSLVSSVISAIVILRKLKPDVLVSFGSYLAVPLAVASWLCGIPIITHEQTRAPGQANFFIGRFAKKIGVTFPETAKAFPQEKTLVTGTPVRPLLFSAAQSKPSWVNELSKQPLLLILGGNQGSATINHVVGEALPELVKDWTIIHQCGNPTSTHDYKRELEKRKQQLPPSKHKNYFVAEWFGDDELGWLLHNADLVVTRSGANTVYELALFTIPSVLIPLPIARHQEQHQNALWLSQAGGAVLLPQRELSPAELVKTAQEAYKKRARLRRALSTLLTYADGTKRLFAVIADITKYPA